MRFLAVVSGLGYASFLIAFVLGMVIGSAAVNR